MYMLPYVVGKHPLLKSQVIAFNKMGQMIKGHKPLNCSQFIAH